MWMEFGCVSLSALTHGSLDIYAKSSITERKDAIAERERERDEMSCVRNGGKERERERDAEKRKKTKQQKLEDPN